MAVLLHGEEGAVRRLMATSDRAQNLTGAWDRLLPRLRAEERKIFASRGRGHWPANSPRTIAIKGRDEPNVDTGRLMRALTVNRARGSKTRRQKTQMLFGVNDNSIYWSRFVGKRRPFIVDDKTARKLGTRSVLEHLIYGDKL